MLQFVYHYGSVMRDKEQKYTKREPLSLDGQWVKVPIIPTDPSQAVRTWYGIPVTEELEVWGADIEEHTGNQRLSAFAPEYLLTRIQVVNTIVEDIGTIRAAHSFNAFRSDRSGARTRTANKAANTAATRPAIFARKLDTATDWTAKDIPTYLARYCTENFSPAAIDGISINADMLDADDYTPLEIKTEGRTVYEILNELFGQNRGLSWRFVPRSGELGFAIRVRSILADGGAAEKTFDLYAYRDATCRIRTDQTRKYDRVIVEGGRFGTVCTVGLNDDTDNRIFERIEPDWDASEELAYVEAATGDSDYNDPGTGYVEKMERNDAIRSLPELSSVYRSYKISDGFDIPSDTSVKLFPPYTNTSAIELHGDEFDVQWYDSMAVLPYTVMKDGIDYAGTVAETHEGSTGDFQRIRLFLCDSDGKWIESGNTQTSVLDDEKLKLTFAASVSPQNSRFAIDINTNRLPHVLQDSIAFDGKADDGVSHNQQSSGFASNFAATIYVQSSHNVRVSYPEELAEQSSDLSSTLVIRLGRQARIDAIAYDTAVGVSRPGDIIRKTDDEVLRDDRPKMLEIAERAYSWYATPRASLNAGFVAISHDYDLGDIITRVTFAKPTRVRTQSNLRIVAIGSTTPATETHTLISTLSGTVIATQSGAIVTTHEVTSTPGSNVPGTGMMTINQTSRYINTVVSHIVYDFTSFTTRLQTQFSELSLAGLLGDE